MEKYGTDLNQLPIDDDQIRLIKKLAGDNNCTVDLPKTKQAANDLIEKLGGEKSEQ